MIGSRSVRWLQVDSIVLLVGIEVPSNWNLVVSCRTDVTSFESRRGDNSRLNRVIKQYVTKNLNVVTDFWEAEVDQ